ncbi:glycosyltransferase family 2 protein [uncultured Streptomyces sp.]|uniref:glycosyltransferase n=1 Tax=uncultured Streptomyces sp. TaxID=174707 RepID=UPI00260D11B3|nr:glycosyltransferase [uncultured Streptomyces sp.]
MAVVVPAHDEQASVGRAVEAVRLAAGHPSLAGVEVRTVVVADWCSDATARVAERAGARVVTGRFRNAGRARAHGVDVALRELGADGTGTGDDGLWIASTDADSTVEPDWLARQAARARQGWEAFVGTVEVDHWPPHRARLAALHLSRYEASRPATGVEWRHPHVHGANLGVAADAYRHVGGFPPLPVGEDHALVGALESAGHRVLRTAECPVLTSGRLRARAAGGFGDHLARLASECSGPAPAV